MFCCARSKELSVVHFYAPWAEQCSQIDDVLAEMSALEEYKEARFARVEAEDVAKVSLKCKVTAVPTVVLLRNGELACKVSGANVPVLIEMVKGCLNKEIPSFLLRLAKPKEFLEDRLKELVNRAPCMLFMKGDPATPRCGFSRKMVSILDRYEAEYKSFDILEDNDVREGLKKFSNWPTYPQLYLNGELIGGLDIVKEMDESGELESMLPKKINGHLNNKDEPLDAADSTESLDDKLRKLVNQAPCMLFMKGSPANPQCGFSRRILSILDGYKADYKWFDILEDNDVREGLKKFSNWPTYPQLYLNGQLIGGLDIVKEMDESGELESMLPKKESVDA